MKGQKILIVCMTLVVAIAAMAFTVLSTVAMQSSVSSKVSFDMAGMQVTVNANVVGAKNTSNGALTLSQNICTYNPDIVSTTSNWTVPAFCFDSQVNTPVVFTVNALNYNVGKAIRVTITDNNGLNSICNAPVFVVGNGTAATQSGNTVTVGGTATATATYTLKTRNVVNQTNIGLTLTVSIVFA
ncbi:MAG: hypothetical protein RR140_00405 [Clostridia bacterium]